MIGRHPGVPVMLAWSRRAVCYRSSLHRSRIARPSAGHGRTLSLVSTGMLLLVLTMTVVGWSLTY